MRRALLRVKAPGLVDEHRFARADVAQHAKAVRVHRDGFGGHHVFGAVRRVVVADDHGADTERVAEGEHAVARDHRDHGVGAAHAAVHGGDGGEDQHRDDEAEEESTRGLGVLRKIMPVTEELDGQKFFTRLNGKRAATPLLAALFVVEVTDIIFAVDSVPAILAVSNESFLVFASNAFAILGLRAMYFLLANAKERFHYLSHALGGILIFVGIKMTVSHWYHMNTYVSLAIIVVMLVAAIVFSQQRNRRLAPTAH